MEKMIQLQGKELATKIKKSLEGKLNGKKLVILQADGQKSESVYVRLKREMGQSLGVEVVVEFLETPVKVEEKVKYWNKQPVDGLMVQLPIRGVDNVGTNRIVNLIDPTKDVDGLGNSGKFSPAVVVAVMEVFQDALALSAFEFDIFLRVGVVGAKGVVGEKLVQVLRSAGYVVAEFDKGDDLTKLHDCGVVVSATGIANLVKPNMLAESTVCVDLGYPDAEFDQACKSKASYWTSVPGGVGPLTIVCLYKNML